MSLAVVVTTFDSAATLRRCLDSVAWADERIVVDGGSADATLRIARTRATDVIETGNPPMLNVNKNLGFERATADWILSLDSDEELSPELAKEISGIVAGDDARAYWLPREHRVLDTALRRGPWGMDRQLRLFRRGAGRFACRDIHEYLDVEDDTATLSGTLWHHRPSDFREYRRRIVHYARHRARRYVAEGRPLQPWRMLFGPMRVVIDALIFRGGILDGPLAVYLAAMLGLESLCDHLYHLKYTLCESSS